MEENCPFCLARNSDRVILRSDESFAIYDSFAVSEGHMLIIPNRHVDSYFELTEKERNDIWNLVNLAKFELDRKFSPDGYNIGINVGEYAGQSIHHVHIHLIPRYKGDVENPRGGVRGVIPWKQNY